MTASLFNRIVAAGFENASAIWLIAKIILFLFLFLEAKDVIVIAYQRF